MNESVIEALRRHTEEMNRPCPALRRQITNGGLMRAADNSALAYFMSLVTDEPYEEWLEWLEGENLEIPWMTNTISNL